MPSKGPLLVPVPLLLGQQHSEGFRGQACSIERTTGSAAVDQRLMLQPLSAFVELHFGQGNDRERIDHNLGLRLSA